MMAAGQTTGAAGATAQPVPERHAADREGETARAEIDRLTHELGHRVKNTLTMVQALANQTFRGAASTEEALAAFGDRIGALARANDAILKESWTNTELSAVAASVLRPHGHAPGSLTIEGPALRLPASAALSFAMALHELSTNARRFGAWSCPEGHVALGWSVAQEPAGRALDLCWTETGGPPAAVPATRHFGLRFIEQSLHAAFGRNVACAFKPTGFECRVHAAPDDWTV